MRADELEAALEVLAVEYAGSVASCAENSILRKTGSCESELELEGGTGTATEADFDTAGAGDVGAAVGVAAVCTGEFDVSSGIGADAVLTALVHAFVEEETTQLFAFDAEESFCFLLDFFEAAVVEVAMGATNEEQKDNVSKKYIVTNPTNIFIIFVSISRFSQTLI